MPDKFKDTFPVPISFVSGEQPSAAKLTAWAAQTNAALNQLEAALGDMHADFHPLFTSTNTPISGWAYGKGGTLLSTTDLHLQILNLARLVGPAAALNPRILSGVTASITAEPLPSDANEFYLRFIPDGLLTFSLSASKFANYRATRALVAAYGDYHFEPLTGLVVVWDGSGSNGTVDYVADTSGTNMADTYYGANFNVYPGPQQSIKCSVSTTTTGGIITLPVLTHQQADWGNTSSALTAQNDINHNVQLFLPAWLTAEYAATDIIADGLLGLWDEVESRLVPGSFKFTSATVVEYVGEDLIAGNVRYSLILAGGTDLTRTVDALRANHREHQHDGTNMDMRIPHANLSESATGHVAGNGGGDSYSFFDDDSQDWTNDHPQYLGRWGRDDSHSENAMLGDLLMASGKNAGVTNPPTFGVGDDSMGIFFGDYSSGPFVRYHNSSDSLAVYRKDLILDDASTNFGWDPARSDSVVIMPWNGATWLSGASIVYAETAGTQPGVKFSLTDEKLILDLGAHLPQGSSITSVEMRYRWESAASGSRVVNVDLYHDPWTQAGEVLMDDDDSMGDADGSHTTSFDIVQTIDKSDNRIYLRIYPEWTSGASFFTLYAIKVNFNHTFITRGG